MAEYKDGDVLLFNGEKRVVRSVTRTEITVSRHRSVMEWLSDNWHRIALIGYGSALVLFAIALILKYLGY